MVLLKWWIGYALRCIRKASRRLPVRGGYSRRVNLVSQVETRESRGVLFYSLLQKGCARKRQRAEAFPFPLPCFSKDESSPADTTTGKQQRTTILPIDHQRRHHKWNDAGGWCDVVVAGTCCSRFTLFHGGNSLSVGVVSRFEISKMNSNARGSTCACLIRRLCLISSPSPCHILVVFTPKNRPTIFSCPTIDLLPHSRTSSSS